MPLIIDAWALQTIPVVILWGSWANRVIVVDRCDRVGCLIHGQKPRQTRKKGHDPGVGGKGGEVGRRPVVGEEVV